MTTSSSTPSSHDTPSSSRRRIVVGNNDSSRRRRPSRLALPLLLMLLLLYQSSMQLFVGVPLSSAAVTAFAPTASFRRRRYRCYSLPSTCDVAVKPRHLYASRGLDRGLDVADDLLDDDDCPFPEFAGNDLQKQLQSPALVRGTPLDDNDRNRNRQWVRSIKSILFDTLFPLSTITTTDSNVDTPDHVLMVSYRRFYALETIARTPYFAYVSALHLLETIGQWRQADFLKLHFCEAWNELHHLLMLEQLLNDQVPWRDKFVAQHVAVGYYWFAVTAYLLNPAFAYNLNQAVEEEAYETYDNFLKRHALQLQLMPAPSVAVQYYTGTDLYLFDSMHHHSAAAASDVTPSGGNVRRPICRTLYDTFVNIRDDEMEHVKTMAYLQGEVCHPPPPTAAAVTSMTVAPPTTVATKLMMEKDIVADASSRHQPPTASTSTSAATT